MKIILSTLFCIVLFSCNNAEDKKSNASTSSSEKTPTTSSLKKETDAKSGALTQNGNYTSLFKRKNDNCDFITAEGLAKSIDVPLSSIKKDENSCDYYFLEANGNKTRFYFTVEAWGNKTILKEIATAKENAEAFGKDSKLSQYRISETGDTYLSMHQNRMIRILNENSQNVIVILYFITTSPSQKNIAQKDMALKQSYAIANYILTNHKQAL